MYAMKITDYTHSKMKVEYLEFPGKIEAVRWLRENDFECMPNSINHDMYLDSFFRHKNGKIGVTGWNI